jgi:hypothetical protein
MSTSPWASTGDLAAQRQSNAPAPRIEALFLVKFDKRVGYVVDAPSSSMSPFPASARS